MTEACAISSLQQIVIEALRARVFDNRGILPPSQFDQIAAEIIEISIPDRPCPPDLGARLHQRGLAFSGLAHAGSKLVETLFQEKELERAILTLMRLEQVLNDHHLAEIQRILSEQARLQRAVQQAITERTQETVLLQQEITERKHAEAALQQEKDAADAANRAKSSFLAHVSHELRTPLNAILGYAQILQLQAIANDHSDLMPTLEKVRTAGNHLLAVISDILDLSKIEADKMSVTPETFALSELINTLVTTTTPIIAQQGNTLRVDYPSDLGTLHTDRYKIQQVLLNLLSNAAQWTQNGTITLNVTRDRQDAQDWIIFAVADTGVGIRVDDLPHLFTPFAQLQPLPSRPYNGTGLGLAISRHLCRIMGGDIAVRSVFGQGSIFTVTLPASI